MMIVKKKKVKISNEVKANIKRKIQKMYRYKISRVYVCIKAFATKRNVYWIKNMEEQISSFFK